MNVILVRIYRLDSYKLPWYQGGKCQDQCLSVRYMTTLAQEQLQSNTIFESHQSIGFGLLDVLTLTSIINSYRGHHYYTKCETYNTALTPKLLNLLWYAAKKTEEKLKWNECMRTNKQFSTAQTTNFTYLKDYLGLHSFCIHAICIVLIGVG